MKIHVIENQTVGQLAAEHPAVRPVLEEYGIDYCCSGIEALGTAAR